ncbi:MAG: histone deacetylase, partial [Chloroflexus aggregans]
MRVFYSDTFVLPLPPGHRFPMEKYALLRERVIADNIVPFDRLHVPEPASVDELVRVHTPAYIERVMTGRLTGAEIRRIGFPWSPQMVERSR